jgi:hypothetical protein
MSTVYAEKVMSVQERLDRLHKFANLSDQQFEFLGISFGLDAIAGLVPVVGDVITGIVSLFTVFEARQMGVSNHIIYRMLFNIAVDVAGGSIPLIGDIFDIGWKVNRRNVALLEKYLRKKGTIV